MLWLQLGILYSSVAQPSTEIYIVNITEKNGELSFSEPVNITNHEGYDNQPEFSADGKKLLYVSMPDTIQTEIYEYNFKDSSTTRMTNTEESEYSPRYYNKGKTVSAVRVNKNKAQRLCAFTGSFDEAEELLPGLDSIGYYTWVNDSMLALAGLNKGLELIVYDFYGGQFVIPEKNIGRCLLKIPGEDAFLFCRKTGAFVNLYRYNIRNDEVTGFGDGLDDVEDYAFSPDGKLYAGKEGKLFVMNAPKSREWIQIADFSKSIGPFYRITVSHDGKRLALVAYSGKKP